MGECLAWKAMAYFYLVRIFGDVPIVHDNSSEIAAGNYHDKVKVKKADVYEYIVMTLEKAIELLPESNDPGRIDRWAAKGLLAKVYLTKSGVNAGGIVCEGCDSEFRKETDGQLRGYLQG